MSEKIPIGKTDTETWQTPQEILRQFSDQSIVLLDRLYHLANESGEPVYVDVPGLKGAESRVVFMFEQKDGVVEASGIMMGKDPDGEILGPFTYIELLSFMKEHGAKTFAPILKKEIPPDPTPASLETTVKKLGTLNEFYDQVKKDTYNTGREAIRDIRSRKNFSTIRNSTLFAYGENRVADKIRTVNAGDEREYWSPSKVSGFGEYPPIEIIVGLEVKKGLVTTSVDEAVKNLEKIVEIRVLFGTWRAKRDETALPFYQDVHGTVMASFLDAMENIDQLPWLREALTASGAKRVKLSIAFKYDGPREDSGFGRYVVIPWGETPVPEK